MRHVDTHVLLCAVVGTLRPRETRLLRTQPWSLAAIVLWEIAKLAQLRRIAVDLDDAEVVRVLSRLHVWPLTREVARTSTQLDIRGDPAAAPVAAPPRPAPSAWVPLTTPPPYPAFGPPSNPPIVEPAANRPGSGVSLRSRTEPLPSTIIRPMAFVIDVQMGGT